MKRLLLRTWPMWAAASLILLCLAHWGQLDSPYIEHDDWDFLLPPGWGHGYATPWEKTLSEGRWLNYVWYLTIGGGHWSPGMAARTFFALIILFACALGYVADRPWISLLAILTAFFSPAFGELSAWPSVLSASACVLALAVISLRLSSSRWPWGVLCAGTFLSVMSYAAVAPVILLAHIYLNKVERLRWQVTVLLVYLASYALSVLCIATLNDFFHGHFGLQIEGWRHALPPHDLKELWLASLRQWVILGSYVAPLWGPLGLWAIAVFALLRDSRQRGVTIGLLAASAVALATDVGLASLSGVTIPFRAMEWPWIALMLPLLLLLLAARKGLVWIGGAGLLWMLALGVTAWNDAYRGRAPAGDYVYALASQLSKVLGPRPAVLVGDITSVPELKPLHNEYEPDLQLRMALLKLRGMTAVRCAPALCQAAEDYAHKHDISSLIFEYRGHAIVYFRPGARLYPQAGLGTSQPHTSASSPL